MHYGLKRPCAKCPFRHDVPGYLRRDRAAEIARSISLGAEFACHQTTVETDDGEDRIAVPSSQFCAGALIVMEKMEQPNQIVRIAERTGGYDAALLDMSAPVVGSFFEFVDHHGEADGDDGECCCICGPDCEAPAGYLVDGVAVPAERTGEIHECPECGEYVCGECCAEDGRCEYCAER